MNKLFRLNSSTGRSLSSFSRVILLTAAGAFIIIVGLIRYLSGTEYALSLFFLFPILFSTWYVGKKAGVFLSFFSTFTWLYADLYMIREFSDPWVPFVNETFRLIVFLLVTGLVWGFKTTLESQRSLARTDHLTGLPNRLAFFESAELELSRTRRFFQPLSVIYLDVDNFKAVNDSLGHDAGDNLLRTVAETILENIRSIDIAARFGGDELGIMLPETGVKGSRRLAEKLKLKLNKKMRANKWPVTFSMGVATFKNIPITIDDMLLIADKLMYFAKKNGKNRISHQLISGKPPRENPDKGLHLKPHFF